MTVSVWLFHLSQGLIASAFLLTDILWLRAVSLLAMGTYLMAAFMMSNTDMLIWGTVFALINAVRLVRLVLERWPRQMTDTLESLYEEVFPALSRKEFIHFWELGSHKIHQDKWVCRLGQRKSQLHLIVNGEVSVEKAGREIVRLDRGFFIAEMSLLTKESVSADVKAIGRVETRCWRRDTLAHLKLDEPQLYTKLLSVFGLDLVKKLKKETALIQALIDH